jgi:NAD(P)-dependent dehydrogenase (short-subunit alcohol dehydrogenase family)
MIFRLIKSILKAQKEQVLDEHQKQAALSWQSNQMPSLAGKIVVITGANSGIGFEAAKTFAAHQAKVFLACRNALKLEQALDQIKKINPSADIHGVLLDLSDLKSIEQAVNSLKSQLTHIDMLCNNAGVMAPPYLLTQDGFELQIGTNHFGHFALTLGLLPLLFQGNARIINVSSMAHRMGKMNFSDLPKVQHYQSWVAYSQSKLANLLFTYGLKQKIEALSIQSPVLAQKAPLVVACHPGYSATELAVNGMKFKWYTKLWSPMATLVNAIFGQSSHHGALPTLFAATHPLIKSGDYIGPSGFLYFRGKPCWEETDEIAKNQQDIEQLWQLSEQLTQQAWSQQIQALR